MAKKDDIEGLGSAKGKNSRSYRDDNDVEGHGPNRRSVVEPVEPEGHRRSEVEEDDVEGHGPNRRSYREPIEPDGTTNRRTAVPEEDDVEGHGPYRRSYREPVEPDGAHRRHAIPGEEEDVEGHVYNARKVSGGEFLDRKLPGTDSPHPEGSNNRRM